MRFRGVKKSSQRRRPFSTDRFIEDVADNGAVVTSGAALVAGTAWLFADPELDRALDYLFVDEAGQVALANLIAMGTCAKNIVLLGDQMQLQQPIQGVHPGHSGRVGARIPARGAGDDPDGPRGVPRHHLAHARRCLPLHFGGGLRRTAPSPPGQPEPAATVEAQCARGAPAHGHSVLSRWISRGCSQRSVEEASDRAGAVFEPARTASPRQGRAEHSGRRENILVVAPYNMQVNLLKQMLPGVARVSAPSTSSRGRRPKSVIVSMATSSGEDLPRNIEFLYSKNRLNVAVSRARSLALLVANPRLMAIKCRTVEQMELVNTLCWVHEYACAL